MGWERRNGGKLYLYRNQRVNGKPVKRYIAAQDRFGFGELMAGDLERLLRREAKVRRLKQKQRVTFRMLINSVLADAANANNAMRTLAEGTLHALGFHKHNRGEWRMRHELKNLKTQIEKLSESLATVRPLLNYAAPENDAEAVELFAKARAGDADACANVRTLIGSRKWVEWIGNIAFQATHNLILKATARDPVWGAGMRAKVESLRRGLEGDGATLLERLLVTRVVNGWIAVHALELEQSIRSPNEPSLREHLDKMLTRAQKRYTEAIRELARVLRLQAPRLLAQLNVVANNAQVNTGNTQPHESQSLPSGK